MEQTTRTCLDCDRTDLHGLWCCQPHYRIRKAAGTLPPPPTRNERFWGHVEKTDSCWLWTSTLRGGYGRFTISTGRQASAHRFAYELLVGKLSDTITIDHLCRVRRCVNPAHLEPVSNAENIRRRPPTPNHRNAVKTCCPNGHPFDVVFHRPDGSPWRACSRCMRVRDAAYRKRSRRA